MNTIKSGLLVLILAGGWVGTAGAGVQLFHGIQSSLQITVGFLFMGGIAGLIEYRRKKRMS